MEKFQIKISDYKEMFEVAGVLFKNGYTIKLVFYIAPEGKKTREGYIEAWRDSDTPETDESEADADKADGKE